MVIKNITIGRSISINADGGGLILEGNGIENVSVGDATTVGGKGIVMIDISILNDFPPEHKEAFDKVRDKKKPALLEKISEAVAVNASSQVIMDLIRSFY